MDKVIYDMGFTKVDKERRIVSGFATLNNVDSQRDRVTLEASIKAFKSFRGNLRELHDKIAAGKVLDFGIAKLYDKVSNSVYDGIFVRAYVSKGAPLTWEKVLDGTLTGFSVAGDITDSETVIEEDGPVRVIKGYELAELSLVDAPANKFANILSIQKGTEFFTTIIDEKELNKNMSENVIEPTVSGPSSTEEQVVSGEPVSEVEVSEDLPNIENPVDTAQAVEDSPKHGATSVQPEKNESGTDLDHTQKGTEVADNDSLVLASAIEEVKNLLEATNAKTVDAFNNIIAQLTELRSTVDETGKELAAVKSTISTFDKRVEMVEKDTAVRKSGDLGEIAQEESKFEKTKSVWGGRFLAADL